MKVIEGDSENSSLNLWNERRKTELQTNKLLFASVKQAGEGKPFVFIIILFLFLKALRGYLGSTCMMGLSRVAWGTDIME